MRRQRRQFLRQETKLLFLRYRANFNRGRPINVQRNTRRGRDLMVFFDLSGIESRHVPDYTTIRERYYQPMSPMPDSYVKAVRSACRQGQWLADPDRRSQYAQLADVRQAPRPRRRSSTYLNRGNYSKASRRPTSYFNLAHSFNFNAIPRHAG